MSEIDINALIKRRQMDAARSRAMGEPSMRAQPKARVPAPRIPTYEQKVARMNDTSRLQYLLGGNRAQRQLGNLELEGRRLAMMRQNEARARQHQLNLLREENRGKAAIEKIKSDADLISALNASKDNRVVSEKTLEHQKKADENKLQGIIDTNSANKEIANINRESARDIANINKASAIDVANINKASAIAVANTEANMKLQAEQLKSELNNRGVNVSASDLLKAVELQSKLKNGGLDEFERKRLEDFIQNDKNLSEAEKQKRIRSLYEPDDDTEYSLQFIADFIEANSRSFTGDEDDDINDVTVI